MNTEKAIEFVDNIPNNGLIFDPLPLKNRKKQLIEMLKRGEKYEVIEKELKQYCLILENQNVLKEIIRLELKHFPKDEVVK